MKSFRSAGKGIATATTAICFWVAGGYAVGADIEFTVSPSNAHPKDIVGVIARPETTMNKSIYGRGSGGRFQSASDSVITTGKFPASSISGAYQLSSGASSFSFDIGGRFIPDGDGDGGTIPWSFSFRRDLLYILPKSGEAEVGDSITFSSSLSDAVLSITGGTHAVSGKQVTFQDAGEYRVTATKDGVSDQATIRVKPKVIDFGPKRDPLIWPKASGQTISKEDFDINFEPTDATWIHSAPSGTPQLEFGVTKAYTAKAIVTKNGISAEKECQYTVMGPGEWWEDKPAPTVVNESFRAAEVKISSYAEEVQGVFTWVRRNGTITGKGNYSDHEMTGWTVKGGSLESSISEGYAIEAQLGTTWMAIDGQISFSYSKVNTVTLGHSGIPGFRIAMKGLREIIPTVTAGTNIQRRILTIPVGAMGLLSYDSDWRADGTKFEENNNGSGVPAKILGKKFP